MSAPPRQRLPPGHAQFVRYAYPPNELGYCGPADSAALLHGDPAAVAAHAREFDGTWPYLRAIAGAADIADPLDAEVVHSYWVGGPLLGRLDGGALLDALRRAFARQTTGVLTELTEPAGVLAHHSFHVFAVYPWVRFLDRAPDTALHVLQNCRIRWGTVESVDGEHATMSSRPLMFDGGVLALGEPVTERVRWRKEEVSLVSAPPAGATVAAHWSWVCDVLTDVDCAALADATDATLRVVNGFRGDVTSTVN